MAKHPFSVPEQVASLATQGCLNRNWVKELHGLSGISVQSRRHDNFTRIRDSDESSVKRRIEVRMFDVLTVVSDWRKSPTTSPWMDRVGLAAASTERIKALEGLGWRGPQP